MQATQAEPATESTTRPPRRFTMYGASDDLVEAEGIPGCDEFAVNPTMPSGEAGVFLLHGPGGSMRIVAFFGRGGVWYFAPAQAAEGVPIPPWPLQITHTEERDGRPGYSTCIEIDVPDGTCLTREARSG